MMKTAIFNDERWLRRAITWMIGGLAALSLLALAAQARTPPYRKASPIRVTEGRMAPGSFTSGAQTQERIKGNRAEQPPRAQSGKGLDPRAGQQIRLQPPNTIRLSVRYNKEYGYRSESGLFDAGPNSCGAFSISARLVSEQRQRDPIRITTEAKMREAAGFYVCDYVVSDLPFNQPVRIAVGLADSRNTPVEAWKGGTQPQPPRGYRRVILDATRQVTLTEEKPRAALVFEMIYDMPPLPSVPR
jgi:hypothetical protein